MKILLKCPKFRVENLLIFLIFFGIFFVISFFSGSKAQEIEANLSWDSKLIIFQENTLFSLSNPNNPELEAVKRLPVIITAYSSSFWETDGDPYITAAGTWVKEGVVASNLLPFGTKIKIPELYGDRIFVVEDRMSWQKGKYQIDIWFSDYWQALSFGAKRVYIEILEG